ncbi:MAG: hypothetical protein WCK53_13005 [Methanomicrobiales archaeon]
MNQYYGILYDIEEHGTRNRHNSPTSARCSRYKSGIDGDEPIEDSIGLYREQFTSVGEGMNTKNRERPSASWKINDDLKPSIATRFE